jgi:peptide/nickel transport system substrate-binding protein
MPLLKENEKKGNYRAVEVSNYAELFLFLNYGNKDKAWAAIAQNPKFRLALSTALNRKEFVKIVYNNLASVPEWAPAYDQAKANQLLDEVGLNKRDSEGWRLRPDGKRMEMNFEFPQVGTDWTKKSELAAEMWKAVGIYSTTKVLEYGLWYTRAQANELFISPCWGHSYQLCVSEPLMIEMLLPFEARWPPTWWAWYSSHGAKGDKPTMPEATQMYDWIDQLRIASTNKERVDLINKVQNLWHDTNLFIIDSEKAIDPWIISAKLGNTPNSGSRHAANASAIVYYYK